MSAAKKILICPLDWGLGHATRCIPIIRGLLGRQCTVVIASSGSALVLLRKEFPELTSLEITGYKPVYSHSSAFVRSLLLQLPRFLTTIRKENTEVAKICKDHRIDTVIADNRYGCYVRGLPSVFVCHQINLHVPFFSGAINWLHRRQIRKFTECWIPDEQGDASLAGDLSASKQLRATYIGHLSRFSPTDVSPVYELLAIVSGPEPQRTIFERLIKNAFRTSGKRTLVIRGVPGDGREWLNADSTEVNHLPASEMNDVIARSEMIISRPGYSTIMDLAVMQKKAIFIPTPGQTEQEYLSRRLHDRGIAFSMDQHAFRLNEALRQSTRFSGFVTAGPNHLLSNALNELLK